MNFTALRDYTGEVIIILLLSILLISVFSLLRVVISWLISVSWIYKSEKFPKVALVVGGSKGLGLAIAHELLERGSDIILIGRGKDALDSAIDELKSCAKSDQKVFGYAGDSANEDWMLQTFSKLYDLEYMPDWIIANAGSSRPGLAADSHDDYRKQISSNYFTCTAIMSALMKLAEIKSNKKESKDTAIMGSLSKKVLKSILPKRLVFVGSVLSLTSFIGYSAYSGSKYALKGLADSLRSELKFLGVKVHLYCPANMDTPGFAKENQIKPKITADIEGKASTSSPKDAALALIGGILCERYSLMLISRYIITNDILGELIRVCTNISGPRPNPVSEAFSMPILSLALGIWSFMVDREVDHHFSKLDG